MTTLDYHVVDVFTDRPYGGNPLAVVLDADELSTDQMQSIAREFNLSETAFVLPTSAPSATYRVRIFTPTSELPFAGHPSIGTAAVLRMLGRVDIGPVVQECGAGLLPLDVTEDRIELTGAAPTMSATVDADELLAAVGLARSDLGPVDPRWCGCGLEWGYLLVHDEAVARVQVDGGRLARLEPAGLCVFSYADGRAHARCFAGGLGVAEDPATGSAALGLGVFLVAGGLVPGDGETSYVIEQGIEMLRPAKLFGTVVADGGAARECRVAGYSRPVATGRISPPTG